MNQALYQFGLLKKVPCTKEENKVYTALLEAKEPLPPGVFREEYDNVFYTVQGVDLSEEERAEYLACKKLSLLQSIKRAVVFMAVCMGLAMFLTLFFVVLPAL